MTIDQLADHIMEFLRTLHEDSRGWNANLDGLLTGIAEVEGADKGYSADGVTKLAGKLISVIDFRRKANKAEEN